jgi:RNA polymerase sigma-70 factor (ECF subfamily)
MLGYAIKLTGGDRHRAEDLVQETLVRAWQKADDLLGKPPPALRSWLLTVLRNQFIDQQRARRVRPHETGDGPLVLMPAPDDLDRALSQWLVRDALASLSPAHRQVIVEIHFRGRSVTELAKTLGIPPGTVKSRTYYAMQLLRLALEERGVASIEGYLP